MNGWNAGMGTGGWILMSLFWLLLVAGVVAVALRLFPRDGNGGNGGNGGRRAEGAGEILDRRLASGEIDHEAYDTLRAKLGGHSDASGR